MRRLGCEYALGQSMSWPQSLVALRSPLIEPLQCEGGTFIYGS